MTVTTVGVAASQSTITVTGTGEPSGTLHRHRRAHGLLPPGQRRRGSAAPADGDDGHPVRPGFNWAAAAGAAGFTSSRVDDGLDFAAPIYSANVSGTIATPGVDLPSNLRSTGG